MIPQDYRAIEECAELADELLLTGGPDIHRRRYGRYYNNFADMNCLSSSRDDLEFALFQRFSDKKKSVMGIGRGLQVIHCALGGTLYTDITVKAGR